MFEGWQRADVISALALGVSGLAVLVSLAAARYTAIQTRLAKRRARDEAAAREPAIGADITDFWPGWYLLNIAVRNRLDTAIVCESLQLRRPRKAQGTLHHQQRGRSNVFGDFAPPTAPPGESELRRKFELDLEVPAAASRVTTSLEGHWRANDVRHIAVLVRIASTRLSRSRRHLEASLTVRLSNARASFAEIIVVTKIPPVSTRTEK